MRPLTLAPHCQMPRSPTRLLRDGDRSEEWKRIVQKGTLAPLGSCETLSFAGGVSWSDFGTKLSAITETAAIAQI